MTIHLKITLVLNRDYYNYFRTCEGCISVGIEFVFRIINFCEFQLNVRIFSLLVLYTSGPQPPVRESNSTGPQAAYFIETEFKFLGLYPKLTLERRERSF